MRGKMTDQQRRFVEAFLKHPNATLAARKAGYSEESAGQRGYELRQNPRISAEIDRRLALSMAKTDRSMDDYWAELSKICFANVQDAINQETGELLPANEWPADFAAAVSGLDFHKHKGTKIRMASKLTAIELYLRAKGILKDEQTVNVAVVSVPQADASLPQTIEAAALPRPAWELEG